MGNDYDLLRKAMNAEETMRQNLQEVQARCTELLEENRKLKTTMEQEALQLQSLWRERDDLASRLAEEIKRKESWRDGYNLVMSQRNQLHKEISDAIRLEELKNQNVKLRVKLAKARSWANDIRNTCMEEDGQ